MTCAWRTLGSEMQNPSAAARYRFCRTVQSVGAKSYMPVYSSDCARIPMLTYICYHRASTPCGACDIHLSDPSGSLSWCFSLACAPWVPIIIIDHGRMKHLSSTLPYLGPRSIVTRSGSKRCLLTSLHGV